MKGDYIVFTILATTPTGEQFILPMHATDLEHARALAECEASELTGYEFELNEIKTVQIMPRRAA